MLTAAAATSILSLPGSYSFASDADGLAAESPGVLSGNTVQAPLEVPVNLCGNSVNVVGAVNPSFGNSCRNGSGSNPTAPITQRTPAQASSSSSVHGRAEPTTGLPSTRPAASKVPLATGAPAHRAAPLPDGSGASARGTAERSPGVLSGNDVGAPVDIPLNLCGNTVDAVALLNPVFGNSCENGAGTGGTVGAAVPVPAGQTPRTPVPAGQTPRTPVPAGQTPRTPEPVRHTPQTPDQPPAPHVPAPRPVPRPVDGRTLPAADSSSERMEAPPVVRGAHAAALAETGADQNLIAVAAASAGLLIGGGILYRRNTRAYRR